MSTRVDLLNRIASNRPSPFLFCNIISMRTRRLFASYPTKRIPELIDVALGEFLEGKLEYEVIPVSSHAASRPVTVGGQRIGKRKKEKLFEFASGFHSH